jgi:hypothetical protein
LSSPRHADRHAKSWWKKWREDRGGENGGKMKMAKTGGESSIVNNFNSTPNYFTYY